MSQKQIILLLVSIMIASSIYLPHKSINIQTLSFQLSQQNPDLLGHIQIANIHKPVQISGKFYNQGSDQYPYTLKLSLDQMTDFNQGNLINGALQNTVKLVLASPNKVVECKFNNSENVCVIEDPDQFYETRIECQIAKQNENKQCFGQFFVNQNLSNDEHKQLLSHKQQSASKPLKDQLRQIIDKNVKLFDANNKKAGGDIKLYFETNKVSISGPNVDKFAWDWEAIKDNLPDYIKVFFELRKTTVDQLLDKIFSQFQDCKLKQGQSQVNVCKATSSGSVGAAANYLSDYDLTVTGNFKVSEMINLFNTAILNYFGNYPFQAFDSNLYGYSFMFPLTQGFKHNITWPVDNVQGLYNYLNNPVDQKFVEQDMWAYNRLQNFKQHDHTDDRIKFSCQKCNKWLSSNNLSEIDTKRKSQKYLERMKVFEKLMQKYPDSIVKSYSDQAVLDVKKQMIQALSHMNYYGDATYFTQGTFAHVIGTMFYYQSKSNSQKIKLVSKRQLLHSLIENLAYFIHAYEDKDIQYAVKYLQRFLDAKILIQETDKNTDSTVTALKKLQKLAGFIKSKVRNLSNKEMFDKLKLTSEYKDQLSKYTQPYEQINGIDAVMNQIRKNITKDFQSQFNSYVESQGFKTDQENNYVYGMIRLIKKVIDSNPNITDIRITENDWDFQIKILALQTKKTYETVSQPYKTEAPQNFKVKMQKNNQNKHKELKNHKLYLRRQYE